MRPAAVNGPSPAAISSWVSPHNGIKASEPVYSFDAIVRDESGAVAYHYIIVDLRADFISGEPRAGDDASDVRWVAAHELDDLALSARTMELLKRRLGFGRQTPD